MGYLQPETADTSAVSPKQNWSKAVIAAKGGAAGTGLWLLDTLLGINSTNATNAANRAMARETNALNYQMFQEQNKFNWDMWKATNKYNSPANQRKLLEEAGYNAALYGGLGSQAANISAAQGHSAQVGNPMQNPYPPGIGTKMLSDSMMSMNALAEARYNDAKATGQNIDNVYSAALKERQLDAIGETTRAQRISNEINQDTVEDQKAAYGLQNKLTNQQITNQIAQEALLKAQKELEDTKVQLTQEQIHEIASVIELNEEMKLTEKSKQQLNKILGDEAKANIVIGRINANANMLNAKANYMNAQTNQRVGAAQEALLGEEQFGLGLKNQLTKTYGAYTEYWNILNMMENRSKTQWDEAFIWRNIQKLNKDINWYEFDKVFNMMKGGADTGKDLMLLKFLLP